MRIEGRFHQAMIGIYKRAKEECDYNATRFIQMVAEKGGLATAKTLLASKEPQEGFTHLWECGRPDLTVEALVLSPEYISLFTDEERQTAQQRLEDYGYF
jgi:hypothetical protein